MVYNDTSKKWATWRPSLIADKPAMFLGNLNEKCGR